MFRTPLFRMAALAVAVTALLSASPAAAAPPAVSSTVVPRCIGAGCDDRAGGNPAALRVTRGAVAAHDVGTGASLAARADAATCADGSGATCGTVQVPLDYRDPSSRRLDIAYKYLRHTTAGKAVSTVTLIAGGPGDSSIEWGDWFLSDTLGESYAAHDILLVDQRGRGSSGALVCDALQHGTESTIDAVRDCGAQLGESADDYTSAFAARDLDRVRAHLGIDKLDLIGVSYGTMDSIAYATRFPSHVRSILMASGASPTFDDFDFAVTQSSLSGRRVQTDLCRRSTHCDEVGDPLVTLAVAAAALRKHPLTGTAPDPEGALRTVTVTQNTLVRAARMDSGTLAGWALPASVAYLRGDPAPLLRLGSAKDWEAAPGDQGDPADHSAAVSVASYCTDATHEPWATGLTPAQRAASALKAVETMPRAPFFPWSGTAIVADPATSTIGALDYCLSWPDTPKAEDVLPKPAVYPDVPVLALVGDYDSVVDQTSTIADASRFRRHQVVTMKGGDHLAAFFLCPEVVQRFVDTLSAASPTCGPTWHWYLQPSFPKTVAAVPTTGIVRQTGDATTVADRKVVAASWRTVLDGWIQAWDRPDFTTSPGLRGGKLYDSDDGESEYDIDLTGYRFVSDLGLTGRLVSPWSDDPSTGTFTLTGPQISGSLTITAHMGLDRDGVVAITGVVNGRRVAVTTSSF